jgi:hypothetical protein
MICCTAPLPTEAQRPGVIRKIPARSPAGRGVQLPSAPKAPDGSPMSTATVRPPPGPMVSRTSRARAARPAAPSWTATTPAGAGRPSWDSGHHRSGRSNHGDRRTRAPRQGGRSPPRAAASTPLTRSAATGPPQPGVASRHRRKANRSTRACAIPWAPPHRLTCCARPTSRGVSRRSRWGWGSEGPRGALRGRCKEAAVPGFMELAIYRTDRSQAPPGTRKAPPCAGLFYAPKRTRTSTGHTAHKALNLARLPIPPPAQVGPRRAPRTHASIARG